MEREAELMRRKRLHQQAFESLNALTETLRAQQRFSEWLGGFAAGGLGFAISNLDDVSAMTAVSDDYAVPLLKAVAAAFVASIGAGLVYYSRMNAIASTLVRERSIQADIADIELSRLEGSAIQADEAALTSLSNEAERESHKRSWSIRRTRQVLTTQLWAFVIGVFGLALIVWSA